LGDPTPRVIYSYDNTYYNKYRCLICEYYTNICNYSYYKWISSFFYKSNETIDNIKEFKESKVYKHRELYKIIEENVNRGGFDESDDVFYSNDE